MPSLRGQPMPREGAGQLPALLLDRDQPPSPPPSQRRRTGPAPSKPAKDATTCPHIGGGYALLPRALALLALDHIRGAFCPCRGECGTYVPRSGSINYYCAVRKLHSRDCGRSSGDVQASREGLSPDDATTGTRLLRGVRRMGFHDERSEAWRYVPLAPRRWLVVGGGP
jgi:hypothetical protein